jgi:formylglycine-generating enzyme required for sulfatase activity
MGSEDGPPNERPVHRVRLTRPYYLGRTEVTQSQFAQFVTETGYITTAEREGGAKVWRGQGWVLERGATFRTVFPGADRPAAVVSWDDAVAFCAWLTERERRAHNIGAKQVFRLPTEAEWERAARAGRAGRYAGTDEPEDVCRYGNVPDEAAAREGLGREVLPCDDGVGIGTAPAGKYLPNDLGLYDLSGNVWEWVADRYGPYPAGRQVNPEGAAAGQERVMRGGSWSGKVHGVQVSHRDGYPPSLCGGAIGFRVAMTAR